MINSERLEEGWVRASALVSLVDALGTSVDADDIQAAALVPLSPAGVQAALNISSMILMNMDSLAAVLAGSCPEDLLAVFANVVWSEPRPRPRRPRRPRPTAPEPEPGGCQ
jgi:hypothetical protein